ncbi:hypothetical protein [Sphingopyxis witflariensis]|uniref:MobA/MobL protein domain-containing protein n=1 Tax=Sphingopyxis witflariensis TaxID=173675 RepID=A0A246K5G6_9SPHN|nr:hypothetical protein [Sphingopyxis witflariensis]OWR01227.1 hypothetical protein CDQ91_02095 [Sphingopyxis witflariensis]
MVMKKLPAPGDLDFVPIPGGADPNLVFGVVRRQIKGGPIQTVPGSVLRRLCPGRKVDVAAPWVPSCYRWDVLLPSFANDEFLDPKRLSEKYEEQACNNLKDLLVMITLRFPNPDRLHLAWEDAREFALERLCRERNVAVIAAMHLPVEVGSTNPPHIHLMSPARELQCFGFGPFVRPFSADAGKAMIAAEWADWQRRRRNSDPADG